MNEKSMNNEKEKEQKNENEKKINKWKKNKKMDQKIVLKIKKRDDFCGKINRLISNSKR